jgi:hypothetical protein
MFGSGVGHVWQISLELSRETRQVQFWTLIQDKAERADMSGSGGGHVQQTSLEPALETKYVRSRDLVVDESG